MYADYYSGREERKKPRGLSFDDLAATPASDRKSASMKGVRPVLKSTPPELEKSEYHDNVFWSVNALGIQSLDDLLGDYE